MTVFSPPTQGERMTDASPEPDPAAGPAIKVVRPERQTLPVVLASPHSGRRYPPALLAATRLDALTLRRSEDSYVDELFAAGVDKGAPLLRALFPRAYVDCNREPFELDPEMYEDPLPGFVVSRSPRIAAGLGTIPRVVGQGLDIYASRLTFAEAQQRIERYYRPYHAALRRLIDRTRTRFGYCILVDCHSMPSRGWPSEPTEGPANANHVDFVLGDCHGESCAAVLTDAAEHWLRRRGYTTLRNIPYAGGYTTRHYGKPHRRVHALQIEINRALYMDESSLTRRPTMAHLKSELSDLIRLLGEISIEAAAAE